MGSTVEQQPVGKLVQQSFGEAPRAESSKPTQSKPNPICDRSGKPVEQENTSCSRETVGKRVQEELGSSDRMGKPVKCEDNRHECSRWNRGNLWNQVHTHSERTTCSCGTS